MNKAYKFRIYPNESQRVKIEKTFNCVRFIYNRMLSDKLAYFRETGKMLKNTPAQYKKEFPWLKEVDSLALANAQLHLQAAYDNFFRHPGSSLPKFKSKKRSKKCYTTNLVYGNIVIRDGEIRLPKMGFIKMKQHRELPENGRLKSVTVSRDAKGKYFVSVLFEYEREQAAVVRESVIGLVYSEQELYTDTNGECRAYPDFYWRTAEQLRREKQRLTHMKKGSKNREKQRHRILRIKEKIANQRNDFLHKQSRQIANAYDCVCVRESAGEAVGDFGWTMFKFFLRYKLADAGKSFIQTDKLLQSEPLYNHQAV